MPEQITIEQRRAKAAWDTLEDHFGTELENQDGKNPVAKQYLNAMRQTATRVHVSGLGQAIAFLRSRNDNTSKMAANDLAYLTLRAMGETSDDPNKEPSLELIHLVQDDDLIKMMRATEEVMGLVAWFTRYLQGAGIVPGDDTDDTDAELQGGAAESEEKSDENPGEGE